LLPACTQDFGVFEGDAAAVVDAADALADADGSIADVVSNDVVVKDAAPVEAATLTYQCGTKTVADCSSCTNMPQPCVFCGSSSLAGKCVQKGQSCTGGAPSGFSVCTCTSAANCPESFDVCNKNQCRTCGDSTSDNTLACKGGGTCQTGVCQ